MTTAIKKLIEHIDQLVHWLKENPRTPMPSHERNRVIAILNKIMMVGEISDKEWEELKPIPNLTNPSYNLTVRTNNQKTITSSRLSAKKSRSSKKTIILPVEKENLVTAIVNRDGKEMEICSGCHKHILVKRLLKHQKKCRPLKQKNNIKSRTPTKGSNLVNPIAHKNDEYDKVKHSDGSYGFHQFRENGKFGSYPSFDNMNDDAHP